MTMLYQVYQLTYPEGHLYSYFSIVIGVWNSGGCQEIVQWGLKKGRNFTMEGCIPGML